MNKIPKKIVDFYQSLENIKSLNAWNINREIAPIEKISKIWKSKILIERRILNYNLNKGILELNFTTTNEKGGIQHYKALTKIQTQYVVERLNNSKNTWLLSRYAHVLWQETKNNIYADIAIDNYLKNIKKLTSDETREFPILFSTIFYISKKTKNKIDEVKNFTMYFLNSDFHSWVKFNILNSILENNIFSNDELKPVAEKSLKWIDEGNPVSYFTNKTNLQILILLFQKLKKPVEIVYEMLANNEDLILKEHPNDEDFVKYTTIGTKASYLRLAKKKKEYEIAMKEYNRLKQTIKLGRVSVGLKDEHSKMFNDYLNLRSETILSALPYEILAFFSIEESILVDPSENKKNASKSYQNSLQNLFTTNVFDINTNFKRLKDSEGINYEIIKSYTITNAIQLQALFFKVLVDGIIAGKLNYYHIHEYLENYTWYGKKFKRSANSNEIDENSTWITLLAPGIHNLISQFELLVIMNTNKIGNFILSIDSLTLKFEGALRDFIRLSGGNTTIEKKGELQEMLLEELLENPTTIEYFTERDIALFKHTFTRKGKNIRNSVAHSFMQFSDYNFQVAALVFLCILRLGKYTFEIKPAANSS